MSQYFRAVGESSTFTFPTSAAGTLCVCLAGTDLSEADGSDLWIIGAGAGTSQYKFNSTVGGVAKETILEVTTIPAAPAALPHSPEPVVVVSP